VSDPFAGKNAKRGGGEDIERSIRRIRRDFVLPLAFTLCLEKTMELKKFSTNRNGHPASVRREPAPEEYAFGTGRGMGALNEGNGTDGMWNASEYSGWCGGRRPAATGPSKWLTGERPGAGRRRPGRNRQKGWFTYCL